MIYDKLENLRKYLPEKQWEKLAPVLAGINAASEEGKYEVDGDRIFIKVMSYDTLSAESCKTEAHDKYIDVQVTISGSEGIAVFPREALSPSDEYNPDKDMQHFCAAGQAPVATVSVEAGMFCLLYPHEAHRPKQIADPENTHVKKFVIKIKL